eukprot:2773939-Pleurochrysis_carterae.AAC.2
MAYCVAGTCTSTPRLGGWPMHSPSGVLLRPTLWLWLLTSVCEQQPPPPLPAVVLLQQLMMMMIMRQNCLKNAHLDYYTVPAQMRSSSCLASAAPPD